MNIKKLTENANKIANIEKYKRLNFSLGYLLDCVYFLSRIEEMPTSRIKHYNYLLYEYYIKKVPYSAINFEETLAFMVSEDLVMLKYDFHIGNRMKYNSDYSLAVIHFNLAMN